MMEIALSACERSGFYFILVIAYINLMLEVCFLDLLMFVMLLTG